MGRVRGWGWIGGVVARAVALGLGVALSVACDPAGPVGAPAGSAPASATGPGASSHIRGAVPTEPAREIATRVPGGTVNELPPAPLAVVAAPIAPDVPRLEPPPRRQLDAPAAAAAAAYAATVQAQAAAVSATQQALPAQEITILDLAFGPTALTVRPGTTVVWRNRDGVMHQVRGGDFDSGRLHAGLYWAAVMEKPGQYTFLCSFHPTMRAEITVTADDSRPVHLGS